MKFSHRLATLQSNVFADMDRAKSQAQNQGKEIIDLSLGSSDLPVAPHIIKAIAESLQDTSTHGYILHNATRDFREAVAKWYYARYGVQVDPEQEVISLIGSQEGTAHLPLAILNPGDYTLVLDPGYPSHVGGVYLAGGRIHPLTLRPENNFLPDFTEVPSSILQETRLLILSYPHNPTTATATLSFFQSALDFCQKWDITLVHDFPYMDMVYEGVSPPPSVLEVDRDKSRSIEFFTFSKSYNMGGFRIGFAIGNVQLIKALRQIKAVVDFNQYKGILNGAIAALNSPPETIRQAMKTFQDRRDTFAEALQEQGWQVPLPSATMYIWTKIPPSSITGSLDFALKLVEKTGVAVSPGIGFGQGGEGYLRFALVRDSATLKLAADKINSFLAQIS